MTSLAHLAGLDLTRNEYIVKGTSTMALILPVLFQVMAALLLRRLPARIISSLMFLAAFICSASAGTLAILSSISDPVLSQIFLAGMATCSVISLVAYPLAANRIGWLVKQKAAFDER